MSVNGHFLPPRMLELSSGSRGGEQNVRRARSDLHLRRRPGNSLGRFLVHMARYEALVMAAVRTIQRWSPVVDYSASHWLGENRTADAIELDPNVPGLRLGNVRTQAVDPDFELFCSYSNWNGHLAGSIAQISDRSSANHVVSRHRPIGWRRTMERERQRMCPMTDGGACVVNPQKWLWSAFRLRRYRLRGYGAPFGVRWT